MNIEYYPDCSYNLNDVQSNDSIKEDIDYFERCNAKYSNPKAKVKYQVAIDFLKIKLANQTETINAIHS